MTVQVNISEHQDRGSPLVAFPLSIWGPHMTALSLPHPIHFCWLPHRKAKSLLFGEGVLWAHLLCSRWQMSCQGSRPASEDIEDSSERPAWPVLMC